LGLAFLAVLFLAVLFLAVAFFVVAFFAVAFFALVFLALAVVVAFFAAVLVAAPVVFLVLELVDLLATDAVAVLVVGAAATTGDCSTTAFGSRVAPLTKLLKAAPGLNLGTTVFFTLTVSPVAGLRARRA
jgi:hypothetical protein